MASIIARLLRRKSTPTASQAEFDALYRQAFEAAAIHDFERALQLFDGAIALDPARPETYYKRGNLLKDLGRLDAALASYDQAIERRHDYAHAYCNRGVVQQALGLTAEALSSYAQAIALDPADAKAHYNRALLMQDCSRWDEALKSYDLAISIDPEFPDAQYNRSVLLLFGGDFERGWRSYEWRWKTAQRLGIGELRNFAQPLWLGENPIAGKRLLLHGEGGLGDTLQFCRYASLAAAQGATVYMQIPAPLLGLLETLEGVSHLTAMHSALPDFDYHCPLMSMPLAFKTTLDSVPAVVSYLHADKARVARWRSRLPEPRLPRIGLAWSGNPNNTIDRRRSIRLAELASLLPPEYQYFCLQKDVREEDRAVLAAHPLIRSFDDDEQDFLSTAALAECMDLIISVDTSLAHLGGALGLRTWILLPFVPDWRWLRDRDDSPWYPSVKLYRQRTAGDWREVLVRVAGDLRREFQGGSIASTESARRLLEGQTLQREGRFERAIEVYDALLQGEPDHAEAYYRRANAQNALGRWEAALADYGQAIELNPGYANAYCNRGAVLERLGRWEEALGSFDRALALNPGDALAHYNRGSVLRELRRAEDALGSYERAIGLKGDYVEAYINRGNLLQELGRHEAAIESFDKAIELKPVFAEAYQGRGLSLHRLRRFEEALASYERAIALNGDYAAAYINRGNVLQELGRHEAAIESYDRAIRLNPNNAEAFDGLGFCLTSIGLLEAAIASYDRALALEPDRQYVLGMRLHAQMHICEWANLAPGLERLAERLEARKPVSKPFIVSALLDSPPLQRLAAEIWVRKECPPDAALGEIPPRPRREKIRVGYFSADFRNHAVSVLTAELFEIHDRSRFEIVGFAFGPAANDPIRARLQRAFDRFIEVRDHTDTEVALLAREIGIDIAVDLGGFTVHSRTKIFALRAAPVQISYIGYLGTMGAPYMDYLVADATIIPAAQQQYYSEKIIYLPSYQVNDSQRRIAERMFTREELGLPAAGFVYSCFNANYKIMPATFELWMRILRRVDGSSLFLYADNPMAQRNLHKEAERRGIEAHRIVFGERIAVDHYLARLRAMDLFLDTLPYNAGTTASDALWAGLPVLTCEGQSFAGRLAASLLRAIDLPELIATTPDEYVDLAVCLAANPAELDRIRRTLADNRSIAPLFDTPLFTRNLELAYVQIYERSHAGLPPDHIYPRSG